MNNLIAFESHHAPKRGGCPEGQATSLPTRREMQALAILAADPEIPNKLIAWEMGDISLHTVRALLRTASMRTGSKSRHELAAWYRDWAAQERIAA